MVSDLATYERWITEKDLISVELRKRYSSAYLGDAADPVLHSQQCVDFVARILNEDHVLSAQELFLLLYASYIHDIGMVSEDIPFIPILEKGEHYKVVESIIKHGNWIRLSEEQKDVVCYLCRWHNRIEFLENCNKKTTKMICHNQVVRTGLLLKVMHICDDYHKLADMEFFER
jgi:hypothetical protein